MLGLTPPRHISTLRSRDGWSRRKPDVANRDTGLAMKPRRTKVCAPSVGRLLVQSDDADHVLQACRIAGNASRYSLLQSVGEYQPLPCVTRRRERLRQRRHEDRAEKPCALARESCGIPVPPKLDPSWVGHPQGVGMLNGEPMKPSVGGKRRQQTPGSAAVFSAKPASGSGISPRSPPLTACCSFGRQSQCSRKRMR